MTRKDYVKFADLMSKINFHCTKDLRHWGPKDIRDMVVNGMRDIFASDNPRFDADRFIEACFKDR